MGQRDVEDLDIRARLGGQMDGRHRVARLRTEPEAIEPSDQGPDPAPDRSVIFDE